MMWNSDQAAFEGIIQNQFGVSIADLNFDASYYNELCGFMGVDVARLDTDAFAQDHCNLFYGFLQLSASENAVISIKQENAALGPIAKQLRSVEKNLVALQSKGRSGLRLLEEAKAHQPDQFKVGDVGLSDFLDGPPHDPFQGFTDLLLDLRVCLERAQIKKRKKVAPLGNFEFDQKHNRTLGSVAFDHLVMRGFEGDLEEDYQRRYAENNMPPNAAIYHFIEIFADFWQKYSPLRFTEGRYEKDAGQNISATVDAVAHCLDRFGAGCLRSLIESKVKQIRQDRFS